MTAERFTGKVLFATGGGSGIAAATARRFAAEGGHAAVVDLDGDRARAVADELDGSVAISCDVADEHSVGARRTTVGRTAATPSPTTTIRRGRSSTWSNDATAPCW